jgi:hypothetical protein
MKHARPTPQASSVNTVAMALHVAVVGVAVVVVAVVVVTVVGMAVEGMATASGAGTDDSTPMANAFKVAIDAMEIMTVAIKWREENMMMGRGCRLVFSLAEDPIVSVGFCGFACACAAPAMSLAQVRQSVVLLTSDEVAEMLLRCHCQCTQSVIEL